MSLCKVCDLSDWEDEEFLTILDELNLSFGREFKHRKHWEYVQAIRGLRKLGCLTPEANALDVGAGHEHPIYYLANTIGKVYATDIYGSGDFEQTDAPAGMLISPEKYAPFPYQEDRLVIHCMDGRDLKYPADCFDIVFSLSSIEHFGGHQAASQAVQEMARVLKPGGTMAITTEVILNDVPHPEFFLPEELYSALVRPSGLQLLEEIDFAISPTLVDNPIDLGTDTSNAFPHIVCKAGSVIFTSVIMFLQKLLDAPPQESETNTRFSISSTSEKSPATTREKQPLLQGLQTISHRFWPRPNEKKQPGLRLPGSVRRAFRNIDERSLEYSHQWDQLAHSSATYSIYATSDQAQFEQGGQDDTARISQWVRPNSVVLDVGCGIGRVEKYLAPFCQELHALDVSEEMLSQARRRLAGLSDVFLHHASATDLSFAQDNTFDLVFSLLVLQHMEKEDAFLSLREIHRVLKPDGLAYLQFPNLFADVYFQNFVQTVEMEERPVHRMRLYTPQEVAFFLDKVGFDIKEQLNEDVEILVLARKRGKQTA